MLRPIHPGEVLKNDFMIPHDLSANKLAQAIHVPANRITALVNGTRGVTADTAIRLACAFGTNPQNYRPAESLFGHSLFLCAKKNKYVSGNIYA